MAGAMMMSQAAHAGAAVSETITLSGTSGAPNVSTDTEDTPTNAVAGWRFYANGDVRRVVNSTYTLFNSGTEWSNVDPANNYWLRATLDSGNAPNSGTGGTGTWQVLAGPGESTLISYEWLEDSDPFAEANTAGTLKIEIATDSGGSNIVATGYYRGTATQFGTA